MKKRTASRKANPQLPDQAAQVPLDVQNAMTIKRLEENVHQLYKMVRPAAGQPAEDNEKLPCADADRQLGINRTALFRAAGPAPAKREIPEALDNLRNRVGDIEDLISGLSDRLMPVLLTQPPSTGASSTGVCPYGTEGASAVFSLTERLNTQLERLRSLLDRVQV